MTEYEPEVRNLKPKYTRTDNKGRGDRLTLRRIDVLVCATETQGHRQDTTVYELTYRPGEDGAVQLASFKRPNHEKGVINSSSFAVCVRAAENAVEAWITNEDDENLSMYSFAGRLSATTVEDPPRVTNEARAKAVENYD